MYAGQLGDDGLVWRTPVSRKRRETGIGMGKEEEKFSRREGGAGGRESGGYVRRERNDRRG